MPFKTKTPSANVEKEDSENRQVLPFGKDLPIIDKSISLIPMTTNLSDSERRAYEAYLLATTHEARQEAIARLVLGSHLYYHLYFLDRFRRLGSAPFSAEEQKNYDQFKAMYPYHQEYKEIEARLRLLKLDDAETDEQKSRILQEIYVEYIGSSFEHYKPEDF